MNDPFLLRSPSNVFIVGVVWCAAGLHELLDSRFSECQGLRILHAFTGRSSEQPVPTILHTS
eukprot:1157411-Pelagomonas_calceolata.AAC.1